jgi:hypothetical protein
MDQEILVSSGQALVRLLDETTLKPRAAMWVHNPDNDIWRLWIVPDANVTDKQEFYRIVSDTITKNREKVQGLDISAIEFVRDDHPAMKGMKRFLHMPGLGSAHFANNTVDGFYLPSGIVLRMILR